MAIPVLLYNQTIKAILSSSRTAQGVSDTQSSPDKQKLLQSSSRLSIESENNVQALLTLFCNLIESRRTVTSSQIFATLCNAARIVNKNMGDQHNDIWRTWKGKYPEHLPPENIVASLKNDFSPWLQHALMNLSPENALCIAPDTEIKLNGEIRPFVDGCGRISRTLAAAILMQHRFITPYCNSNGGDQEYYKDFRPPWTNWKTWYESKVLLFQE